MAVTERTSRQYSDSRYLKQVIEELQQEVRKLKLALRDVPRFGYAPAASTIGLPLVATTLKAGTVQVGPDGSTAGQSAVFTAVSDANVAVPVIQAKPPSIQIFIIPQLGVYDNRDSPPAAVIVADEQQAFDGSLTQRTYSEISLVQGGTMRVDGFNTISYSGGLGPGVGISRRCGLQWGASGNWGVDFSFPWRYHNVPTSISLSTVVSDSLNSGTKSVVDIDYFGASLQIAGTAGGGFTLNRWTASGGN